MIRLRASHRDLAGTVRTIFIYDRELETASTDVVICTDDFYSLKVEGDEKDPFQTILPASCTFTIFTEHPTYTEAQREAIFLFYEDFTNSYEGRFYVRCQYGEDLGLIKQEFYGKILPDIGEMVLDLFRTVTLTAICGITGLKDVEYRPEGYSDTDPEFAIRTDSFIEHFCAILRLNDVVDFFQNETNAYGLTLFTTSGNWTESKSETGDIFKQVRVRNYWFEQVSPSYRKYASAWDVLSELLTGFVARCIYADGHYHIEQLGYQDTANPTIYGYNFDGDPMLGTYYADKENHTIWETREQNLQVLTWPSKRWLAPFKAIELEDSKQFTNYINGLYLSATLDGWGATPYSLDFGPVVGAVGNKLVAMLNADISSGTSTPTWSATLNHEYKLRFKIKIGDYFLRITNAEQIIDLYPGTGQYQVTGNGVPILEWSLVDSTVTFRWQRTYASINLTDLLSQMSSYRNWLSSASLVFESLEIQADGPMTWDLIDFAEYINGNPLGGSPPAVWTCRLSSKLIIASGYKDLYEKPKGIKRYEIGDVRNTLVYKVKMGYYDSEVLGQFNSEDTYQLFLEQLFIKNSIYVTTQEPTVEWTDPDNSLTLPIQDLMLKTMLAMRALPGEVLIMDVYFKSDDRISPRDRFLIHNTSDIYLILNMELNAGTGIYKLTLWKMYRDLYGINPVDTGDPIADTPAPVPDGSLDAESPGNSNSGVEYYEEWTNVTTNYVDIGIFLANYLPSDDFNIKTKWHFFINGVRQRYVDATPVLRTWRFLNPDPSVNRIEYFKGSGPVAHIELIKYY